MGEAFLTRRGSGKPFAIIGAAYPSGTVTCAKDGVNAKKLYDADGEAMFSIPSVGEWTVTATDGTHTASQTVNITAQGQTEKLELNYALYIFLEGSGLADGYSAESISPSFISVSSDKIILSQYFMWIEPNVSLADFSTLKIELKCTFPQSYGTATFGVGTDRPATAVGNYTASQSNIHTETRDTFSVDISSLTDTEYIKLEGTSVEIYNIWLE